MVLLVLFGFRKVVMVLDLMWVEKFEMVVILLKCFVMCVNLSICFLGICDFLFC